MVFHYPNGRAYDYHKNENHPSLVNKVNHRSINHNRSKTIYGNRGMSLEEEINESNQYYLKDYIYNNINNIYINIFNTWNNININKEKVLRDYTKKVIYKALEIYKEEEIIKSIKNYKKVYISQNHYYSYRWTLINFLSKPNGISRFMDNGDMWLEYKSIIESSNDEFIGVSELDDFDIESYIDI